MPPTRNPPAKHANSNKRDGTGTSHKKEKRHPARKQPFQDGLELPGVQKLKAALRQTRRLLAKDNLAADVRVETERRLKSLESDLALAETKKKERTMATKYHMVKFFERKKVVRRIIQVKKELNSTSPSSSKSVANLEKQLTDLRIDLNYIMHFPKLQKYVSLFPASDQDKQTVIIADDTPDETDRRRRSMRDMVHRRMEEGELSQEPELDEHRTHFTDEADSRVQQAESDNNPKSRQRKKVSGEVSLFEEEGIHARRSNSHDDFFETDDD